MKRVFEMRFLIVGMSIAAAAVSCAGCDVDHPRAADTPPAAAVAPAPAPAPAEPLKTPVGKECDAAAAGFAQGRLLTPALLERARVRAGAEVVRTVRPGQAITLEFLAGRLTLRLDERGKVIGIDCG